jgi:hypothetical protein
MKRNTTTSSCSSTTTATRRVAVAIVAVVGLIGLTLAPTAAVADDEITDLDADTGLTTEAAWNQYQSDGVTNVDVAAPDMTLSFSKTDDGVDLDGWNNDYTNDYLRVQYHEEIDRTVRFYVPSNYFAPYYDKKVVSEDGNAVAKFVPVDDGRYTAVSITFDGPTDAVFAVDQAKGKTWSFWSTQDDRLENATGVSSGIDGGDQWNYVEDSEWTQEGTVPITNVSNPDELRVQYDAGNGEKSVWLTAPESSDDPAPIHYTLREPANESANVTLVIVSDVDDPPAVRVKRDATKSDDVFAILNDWGQIGERFDDLVDSIFGSGNK